MERREASSKPGQSRGSGQLRDGSARLARALVARVPLLMDGPTGTELARRGVDTSGPGWSARANATESGRATLVDIHEDYARAGAWLHTANTFRTNPKTLAEMGVDAAEAGAWVAHAVEAAREGIARVVGHLGSAVPWPGERLGEPVVVGSLAPVADCYRPDLAPEPEVARAEHAAHVRLLEAAGVDGFLVETMNTRAEAVAATAAAVASRRPVLTAFVCAPDGALLSGEPLAAAARAVVEAGASAVLVNCTSVASTGPALRRLLDAGIDDRVAVGAYPNGGTGSSLDGWQDSGSEPMAGFSEAVVDWRRRGVDLIGTCCGTTPAHTAALASLVWGEV